MKKILISVLILTLVFSAFCLFVSCGGGGSNDTYYEVEGYGSSSTLKESSWIKLKSGKWSDDSGESGKYKKDGDKITFLQDGEEIMTGTLKDGTLELELFGMPAGTYRTKSAQEKLTESKNSGTGTDQNGSDSSGNGGGSSSGSQSGQGSTSSGGQGEGIISEDVDNKAKVKSIDGGTVDGMTISYEVGENIEYVDLSGKLTVSKDSSWQLYEDITGQRLIPTKYAANLRGGNNTFYIVVNSSDNKINRTYTLNIWKNYYVTISYYVLGELFGTQRVLTHTYLTDYTAPHVDGYTFNGWGCAGRYVSSEGMNFNASMTAKVYAATLNANGGSFSSGTTATRNVTYGSVFSLPVPALTGYSFTGWFIGNTQLTSERGTSFNVWGYAENKTLTARWTPNSYTITAVANDGAAGTVSGGGTYDYDSSVTLTASTNNGYTWLGWYEGETKVSEGTNLTYTFPMPAENKTYTAKWAYHTITYHLDGGVNGENPACFETYLTMIELLAPSKATNVEITATVSLNGQYQITRETTEYAFLGWYTEQGFETQVTEITYTGEDVDLFAKWSEASTTTTTEQAYLREENYIYFGTYPQTVVTDGLITTALNSAAGTLPTASNNQNWTSYGYYISSRNTTDYMWYIDLSYGGEKYRGVYFTSHRPYNTTSSSSADNSHQDDNGYTAGNVYWFKYEPIKWRILSESNGKALLLADMIIDSQEYCHCTNALQFEHNGGTGYPNNYALSNIRNWLNITFYNTAFTDLQKQIIQLTTVDNSARSTSDSNNRLTQTTSYACANTEDYVFLLSEQEVTNADYGFNSGYSNHDTARQKKNTDYAKVQGAYTDSYDVNGYWWLRSPYYFSSCYALRVDCNGYADCTSYVISTNIGVVPALKISLS